MTHASADRPIAARTIVAQPISSRPDVARPIHVLFLLTSAGVGGAEMQTISLLNRLDPARFTLSLAYLQEEHDLLDKIDRTRVNGAVFCCHVARNMDWQAARRLADYVRAEAVDIVVCANFYPLLYGWAARVLARRPVHIVEVCHSIWSHLGSLKAKLQMLLYGPLLRMTRMLVYVCENQRRHWRVRMLGAREDVVIHNGIDTTHFSNGYSEDQVGAFRAKYGLGASDYVVGLCAYMRPEKAHGDLLAAALAARAHGVELKCLLIGDGPERGAIEEKIARLGLEQQVSITGLIGDVRLALASCDVLVFTSHSETFSIAALESMAMGKPVVMTDVGGASEQVVPGENGYLFRRGDTAALAGHLAQLADPARRRQMGQRACSTVSEKFSLGVMVSAYERMFLGLMRPRTKVADGAHG
jgi:glycosyltransferase involved in cell wall biosynthesis